MSYHNRHSFTRICKACRYSASSFNDSYFGFTIGPPYVKCPKCGHVQKNRAYREWIQMNNFLKILSVLSLSQWTWLTTILTTLFVPVIVSFVLGMRIYLPAGLVVLLLNLVIFYLVNVRSQAFVMAYGYSIYRTDSEEYRRMLDIPDPTDHMKEIPFYSLPAAAKERVAEIRAREHKESAYFSPFEQL